MPSFSFPEKEKIKEGDIVLFKTLGFSPFSWAIRVVTGSPVNHIAQVVKCRLGIEITIIHGIGKGVRKDLLSSFINPKYRLTIVRVNKKAFNGELEYSKAIRVAIERANKMVDIQSEYDWGAIIGLSWRCIFRRIGLGKLTGFKSILNKRMKFICQEVITVAWADTSSKVKYLFAGKRYHKELTPHDTAKSRNVYYVTGQNYPIIRKKA